MKTYTINIGRNNNQVADRNQMLSTFSRMLKLNKIRLGKHNCIRMDGEYKGIEPTFVAEFEADDTFDMFSLLDLCNMIYTQECIAISSNDREWNKLQYSHTFDGEEMAFNYDYFLWVKD